MSKYYRTITAVVVGDTDDELGPWEMLDRARTALVKEGFNVTSIAHEHNDNGDLPPERERKS